MPAGARAALQQFLTDQTEGRPQPLPARAPVEGEGTVEVRLTSRVRAGEVFLKDAAGAAVRLAWGPDGARRFALAPGTYSCVGYRLIDGEWHVSVGASRPLRVRAGETVALDVDDPIVLTVAGFLGGDGVVQLQVGITSKSKEGLTLYRGGRRIPVSWTFLDAKDQEVGTGPLSYG